MWRRQLDTKSSESDTNPIIICATTLMLTSVVKCTNQVALGIRNETEHAAV